MLRSFAKARERKAGEPVDRRTVLTLSASAGVVAGLCCLPPIVLVLLALTNVALAASIGDVLYGDYRWLFRVLALLLLSAALVIYFRRRGVCTLDHVRRRRTWILSVTLITLMSSVAVYIFWTYVVLHYWGIAAGLPWGQYDESWAIPTSAVLFALVAFLFYFLGAGPRSRPRTK